MPQGAVEVCSSCGTLSSERRRRLRRRSRDLRRTGPGVVQRRRRSWRPRCSWAGGGERGGEAMAPAEQEESRSASASVSVRRPASASASEASVSVCWRCTGVHERAGLAHAGAAAAAAVAWTRRAMGRLQVEPRRREEERRRGLPRRALSVVVAMAASGAGPGWARTAAAATAAAVAAVVAAVVVLALRMKTAEARPVQKQTPARRARSSIAVPTTQLRGSATSSPSQCTRIMSWARGGETGAGGAALPRAARLPEFAMEPPVGNGGGAGARLMTTCS
mmetsp:Transcript_19955/g.63476  ORF Transcript_19955/g.63476 Transcript_19955/m.63476 type:complete len:278 (-) Transcript_19955:840-1673(-)